MMRLSRFLPVLWAAVIVFSISGTVVAQGKSGDNKSRHYGIGHPKTTAELPNGKLRRQLESLPAKSRGKALGWLQRFEFPVEDIENIHVNKAGDVLYADNSLPSQGDAPLDAFELSSEPLIDLEKVFKLHSNPGASNTVFLDFDGHVIGDNTAWSPTSLVALPFDPSQNDNPATKANFTQDEINRIFEIWHRIAEDFAPFNIDVTTEEPPEFTSTTGHVLFTHTYDANGRSMPYNTGGGVAYVDVFGESNYVSTYSPALVYYSNLSASALGMPFYNAEAGSHEFGHNLGLSHDGTTANVTYYEGSGAGFVSWAPIMGKNYHRNVTIWSKGEYPDANNTQDDLAIISAKLGYLGDDHGDSAAQATPLRIEPNGDVLVSSPVLDPDNLLSENKGVIDSRDDRDWFYLDSNGEGTLSIQATPAWHSFNRTERRGANLDVELSLYDAALNLVANDEPDDETFAFVETQITGGRYYLVVDGVDNYVNSDYSDYASTGMFFIEGTVQTAVSGEQDVTPPSPGTMTWQTAPTAMGETSISMTAVTASDESGSVEYQFTCVTGESGCIASNWQSDPTYLATGLQPATYYAFTVTARDANGNQNNASSAQGTHTDSPVVVNAAPVALASYSPDPAVIQKGKSVDITLDGAASHDTDGIIVAWEWTDEAGSVVGTEVTATVRRKEGNHRFTLTVTDDAGDSDSVSLEVSVTKPAEEDGPVKGKGKKG